MIAIDLGPAGDKLAAEFERAEARIEARERARRAPPLKPRDDVPAGAADAIARARTAIAVGDFIALEAALVEVPEGSSFEVGPDLHAKTPRGAITGWRAAPAMLERLDAALVAPCEIERDDDLATVSCGVDEPGAPFVILMNQPDGASTDAFRIYSVGTRL